MKQVISHEAFVALINAASIIIQKTTIHNYSPTTSRTVRKLHKLAFRRFHHGRLS